MLTRNDRRKINKKIATRRGAEQFFDNIVSNFFINIEILEYVTDEIQFDDLKSCYKALGEKASEMMTRYASGIQGDIDDKPR